MPAEEETETTPKASKLTLFLGLALLGAAAALYIYARSKPCNCGEAQVAEVAAESARIAEANGTGALHEAVPKTRKSNDA